MSGWACLVQSRIPVLQDTAASYGLGALGGLMYLRLLSKSVDGFGASFMGAATGPSRFAIPVILALTYNRWAVCVSTMLRLT